jgi:hypothetical protein
MICLKLEMRFTLISWCYKPYKPCGNMEGVMLRNATTMHNDADEWHVKRRRQVRVRLVCVLFTCVPCVQMS